MNLRTIIDVDPSDIKITCRDKVMFIGSCFAAYMGAAMQMRKMPVMINPAGTVFNPASVLSTLENIISGRIITADDLYYHDGTWLSFFHYTDFSSEDQGSLIEKVNACTSQAGAFLRESRFLFITLGTARVYRFRETGEIVSNCHKLPSSLFDSKLLTVNDIVNQWESLPGRLSEFNPELKVIFTISPVRHWKDSAHGNQVSKSVLFLAVEELMKHHSGPGYFPAYELLMDDLRDYRFYSDDMLHPSASAVEYIWQKFSGAYFDAETLYLQNEILKINRAFNHRFITGSGMKKKAFAEKILKQISDLQSRYGFIDFTAEKDYFHKLC
jgi:hypothetical protein